MVDVRRSRTRLRAASPEQRTAENEAIQASIPLAPIGYGLAGALGWEFLGGGGGGSDDGAFGGLAETIRWLVIAMVVGGIGIALLILLTNVA